MRTSTCSGPGSGIGRSSISSGRSNRRTTAAFMAHSLLSTTAQVRRLDPARHRRQVQIDCVVLRSRPCVGTRSEAGRPQWSPSSRVLADGDVLRKRISDVSHPGCDAQVAPQPDLNRNVVGHDEVAPITLGAVARDDRRTVDRADCAERLQESAVAHTAADERHGRSNEACRDLRAPDYSPSADPRASFADSPASTNGGCAPRRCPRDRACAGIGCRRSAGAGASR